MKLLAALLAYLPAILTSVVAIQQAFGSTIPGTAKKQLVLNVVQASVKAGESIPEPHVQAISAIIDATVATLKGTPLFPATPATSPAVAAG